MQNYVFFYECQNRKNTYQRHRLQNAPKTSKCTKDARSKPMPLTHNHKRILHAAFDKNHALRNTKQHIYHIKNTSQKKSTNKRKRKKHTTTTFLITVITNLHTQIHILNTQKHHNITPVILIFIVYLQKTWCHPFNRSFTTIPENDI